MNSSIWAWDILLDHHQIYSKKWVLRYISLAYIFKVACILKNLFLLFVGYMQQMLENVWASNRYAPCLCLLPRVSILWYSQLQLCPPPPPKPFCWIRPCFIALVQWKTISFWPGHYFPDRSIKHFNCWRCFVNALNISLGVGEFPN